MKNIVLNIIYRFLRTDLVGRMRENKFTWTKINHVLKSLGQKQIVQVEYTKTGVNLFFSHLTPNAMERNSMTLLQNLAEGDRFYFLNDKKKEIHEKVINAKDKTGLYAKKDNERFPSKFRKDTQVVFLRSTKKVN